MCVSVMCLLCAYYVSVMCVCYVPIMCVHLHTWESEGGYFVTVGVNA